MGLRLRVEVVNFEENQIGKQYRVEQHEQERAVNTLRQLAAAAGASWQRWWCRLPLG